MPNSRLWSIPLFTLALIASAQQPRLQFQNASVEVYSTAPGEFMMRMNGLTPPVPKAAGNRFAAKTHLSDLISEAYGIFVIDHVEQPSPN